MAVSKETVQILVIVFFSILILGGIILLIAGCYFETETEKASDYFDSGFRAAAILCIIAGVLCLVGALLGLFGAILLGKWLLFVGCVFVIVTICCSIAGGAFAYNKKDDKGMFNFDKLKSDFFFYSEHKTEVDNVQRTYQCCGYKGSAVMTDFYHNGTNATRSSVFFRAPKFPKSCCRGEPSDCSPTHDDKYDSGCQGSIESYMRSHGVVLLGVVILIGIFEVLAFVFGLLFVFMFWGNPFKKGGGGGDDKGGGGKGGGGAGGEKEK